MSGSHSHSHGHSHGHAHSHSNIDSKLKRRLKIAAVLTGIIFFAELFGGLLTHSLALISDSIHVFMDLLALLLSFLAIYVSELAPTEKRTYGLHRAEVFASFVNGASLILVSGFILYKAYGRFNNPVEVDGLGMFAVALIGLVVNVVVAYWLHSYAKTDLNIKSAFLHVIGDAAASVGVIIAAIVIHYTGFFMIDAIISIFIAIIILFGSLRIVLEASHILLEGVPREVDLKAVKEAILALEDVKGVHSLHIWSICYNVHALSAHVDVHPTCKGPRTSIVNVINDMLAEDFHILYTTIQPDCASCNRNDTLRTITHAER